MKPIHMNEIVNGKRYRTSTATLIAGNDYWDGHNWERGGRNTFLFRTPKGAFFLQHQTQWQGEQDRIEPVTIEEAKSWYEQLSERVVDYAEAFGEEAEEA